MVNFTNIFTDKNWIYADAESFYTNRKFKIKVSIENELFEITPNNEYTFDIQKAIWYLPRELRIKGKLPKEKTIAWG